MACYQLGFCDTPEEALHPETSRKKRYTGLDARELSEMTIDAHRSLYADFLKKGGISESRAITAVASIPQVRMTRRLAGLATPDEENPYAHVETSIGMFADWRRRGVAYELPLRCAVQPRAGQCVCRGAAVFSVTDRMWDMTRVIPRMRGFRAGGRDCRRTVPGPRPRRS